MQLIFKPGDGRGEGHLFLTKGEQNSADFRILAETEFWDLSTEDQESFDFFIEEVNGKL